MKVDLEDFRDYVLPKLSAISRKEMQYHFSEYQKRKLENAFFAINKNTQKEIIEFIEKHGIDKFLKIIEIIKS